MDDFSKQKIVWADVMRISKTDNDDFPRFAMVDEAYFALNSCYLITGERLDFLIAVLNSELGIFYYFTRIVSLDEGGIRMRSQYIEQMPIPQNKLKLETEIIQLYRNADDKSNSKYKAAINRAVYKLYSLTDTEIAYIREFIKARFKSINNR